MADVLPANPTLLRHSPRRSGAPTVELGPLFWPARRDELGDPAQLLVDVDTSFTAGYGDTLSWSIGEGPGLGEKPVQVVLDIDLPKFEALTMDLLSRRAAGH